MTQYKLVPVEPTPEMVEAGFVHAYDPTTESDIERAWAAMLAAAPEPDVEPVAWMHPESNRWIEADYDYSGGYGRSAKTAQQYGWRPLYAAPQPANREPVAWQPIETAPKDATPILIYCPNARKPVQEVWWALAYEGDSGGHWQTPIGPNGRGYTILPTAPTHWMPLPSAPGTAPQPAKQPLTDKTLWEMWVESPSDVLRFARAIEAAHGITGDKS